MIIAGSNLKFENSSIYNNTASFYAGGINVDYSTLILTNSLLADNK